MWTVRKLFTDHYCEKRKGATKPTRQKMCHELNRFEKYVGDLPAEEVTRDTFDKFRRLAMFDDLSPHTIETTIGTVLTILRFAELYDLIDRAPRKGEPLRRMRNRKFVPSVGDIDVMYRRADLTEWPKLPKSGDFWRAFLVVSYFTGLRFGDIFRLGWDDVKDDAIVFQASKTGKVHTFPMHPVLRAHLETMRVFATVFDHGRVLPAAACNHLVRRELARMSEELPKKVGPQALRRLAGTEWQKARWGAGQLLLGHSLGVSDFYLCVPQLLREALEDLKIPPAFVEGANGKATKPESDLERRFSHLSAEQRDLALSMLDEVVLRINETRGAS